MFSILATFLNTFIPPLWEIGYLLIVAIVVVILSHPVFEKPLKYCCNPSIFIKK